MNIAILTSVFFQKTKEVNREDRIIFGGAERYLVELCKFLMADGHKIQVYQAVSGGDRIFDKEYAGIPIKCLPVKDYWEFHTGPNLNQAFYELSLNADLRIYFASFLAWPMVKHPCISINHGVFWDFPDFILRKLDQAQRTQFFERQIFGMTAPDICVAVDTNVRNVVAALNPGDERKICVIPNFVDTREFYPREGPRTWERIRVLFPRRLVPLRGINEFINAANALPEYDFFLCGQSADLEIESALARYGEQTNVKNTMRPMEEMTDIYREADIAVIPTRAAEGTSLSCLEAMASGLPVITTPVGGLPNLVIDKWNGTVLDLNHDDLAKAIKELAQDEARIELYGLRNRAMAEQCFSLNIWQERWNKVLKRFELR